MASGSTQVRITELQEEAKRLERDIRILEGRIKNQNLEKAKAIQQENEKLQQENEDLNRILSALMIDFPKFRSEEDASRRAQALRLATLDFCKTQKIDENLWKSIES